MSRKHSNAATVRPAARVRKQSSATNTGTVDRQQAVGGGVPAYLPTRKVSTAGRGGHALQKPRIRKASDATKSLKRAGAARASNGPVSRKHSTQAIAPSTPSTQSTARATSSGDSEGEGGAAVLSAKEQAALTHRVMAMSVHEKLSTAFFNIDHAHVGYATSSAFLASLAVSTRTRLMPHVEKLQLFTKINTTGDGRITALQFEHYFVVSESGSESESESGSKSKDMMHVSVDIGKD